MIADIVEQTIGSGLVGFARKAETFWVSESVGHIRKLFHLQGLKGNTLSARWGFSLDFVPKLSGADLVWKRTIKSADFDLCIDPIDKSGSVPDWCSFPHEAHRIQIERVAKATFEAALADFARITSVESICRLFEERTAMQFARFSLQNYVQTDLAWGLALMAIGRTDEGKRRISDFCEAFSIDSQSSTLIRATKSALELQRS